jgi:hypothetical protein
MKHYLILNLKSSENVFEKFIYLLHSLFPPPHLYSLPFNDSNILFPGYLNNAWASEENLKSNEFKNKKC